MLRAASLDGRPVRAFSGREAGHPAYVLEVQMSPGATRRLVLQLDEPVVAGQPSVPEQSLVRRQRSSATAEPCG